jgi:hypothetical protein
MPRPTPAAPPAEIAIDETVRTADGPMTLSMQRVAAEGWSGRLVVASFAPEGRSVRVVPSERAQPLDAIVGPLSPRQPFAAIDGGFYDLHGEAMGLVRTGGRDVHPLTAEGGSGVLVIEGRRARIVHRDAYDSAEGIGEAVQSIDRLAEGGRVLVGTEASLRRAARSAVAIDADGGVHLVVAFDERSIAREEEARIVLDEDSATTGPTLREMAELLVRAREDGGVGARDALGLDGGFSTSLTVKSAARALRVEAFRGTSSAVLVSADQ